MKEAGLTHGGFYAHFASRNALLAEAMDRAWRDSAARTKKDIRSKPARGASPFRALVESYLSDRHVSETEYGCPLAALASEIPRQTPEVRTVAAHWVRDMLATVQQALPDAQPDRCALIATQLVGTVQLARALGGSDERKALLAAARRDLLSQYDKKSL